MRALILVLVAALCGSPVEASVVVGEQAISGKLVERTLSIREPDETVEVELVIDVLRCGHEGDLLRCTLTEVPVRCSDHLVEHCSELEIGADLELQTTTVVEDGDVELVYERQTQALAHP